jgi:hypothetical protein
MTSTSGTPSRVAISLDLIGAQIALLDGLDLALHLAQIEEQLLLARRRAHLDQRPGAQDELLDGRLDPPHGVGGEAESLVGLEPLDRLHEPDIALRDDLRDGQAVAAVAHGDLGHQAQMAGDQAMGRLAVVVLAPALGEHVFLVRLQHRELPDLLEIALQPPSPEAMEGSSRLSSCSCRVPPPAAYANLGGFACNNWHQRPNTS